MNLKIAKFTSLFPVAAIVLLLFVPVSVRADSFLANADFSTGNFAGWTVTGTSPNYGVATPGTVISGTNSSFGTTKVIGYPGLTYAGYALVCSYGPCLPSDDPQADKLELSQQISVVAGDTYTTGFYLAAGGGPGDSAEILVDGTPIVLTSDPRYIDSTYQLVQGSFTASDSDPTITYVIDGSGEGDAGFSFDNFSVNGPSPAVTPEPSSLLLLGTGLLGLMGMSWQRRRLA